MNLTVFTQQPAFLLRAGYVGVYTMFARRTGAGKDGLTRRMTDRVRPVIRRVYNQ